MSGLTLLLSRAATAVCAEGPKSSAVSQDHPTVEGIAADGAIADPAGLFRVLDGVFSTSANRLIDPNQRPLGAPIPYIEPQVVDPDGMQTQVELHANGQHVQCVRPDGTITTDAAHIDEHIRIKVITDGLAAAARRFAATGRLNQPLRLDDTTDGPISRHLRGAVTMVVIPIRRPDGDQCVDEVFVAIRAGEARFLGHVTDPEILALTDWRLGAAGPSHRRCDPPAATTPITAGR